MIEQGYQEGFKRAGNEDNIEAFHLGYHRGIEIGLQLGYYSGLIDSYLTFFKNRKDCPERIIHNLEIVEQLIKSFPKSNSKDVDILGLFEDIKGKVKKICALLKIKAAYPKTDSFAF